MTTSKHAALSCGGCGEVFAHAAFGGSALFLAETLHAAALVAGWHGDDGAWTCTVCLAKADAEPQPEAAAPVSGPAPVPDTDPIGQSVAILADYDDRIDAFWADVNRSNNEADLRIRMRLADAQPEVAA